MMRPRMFVVLVHHEQQAHPAGDHELVRAGERRLRPDGRGLTRARSVITCSAGDSGVTRAASACVGRRNPAPAPSSRIGSGS